MKLRTSNTSGEWTCIDDETYSGPGDLIGTGATEQAAKDDFFEQWIGRQVDNDIRNALPAMESWDAMLRQLVFGARQ